MPKWKVKIWEQPLEVVVTAETSTQAEEKALRSQGLQTEDVLKVKVWQNETSVEFDDIILTEEDQ